MTTDAIETTYELGGRTWTRMDGQDFETGYGGQAPLRDDEYDWDPAEVDFDILGGEVPQYFVVVQPVEDDRWEVSVLVTNGPEYGRAGEAEALSGEYLDTVASLDEAVAVAKEFMADL